MSAKYTLVSHALCPYVQRVAIVLAEKGLDFERIDIDLSAKPAWFLEISPLGKTPVLLTGGTALFESAAICEYLDETALPRLHPDDVLVRAQHRAWIEFGSALLNTIGAFYNAPDRLALQERAEQIGQLLRQLEQRLGAGPYFNGEQFCLVDAVFGPVFRYFDVFDMAHDFGFLSGLPKVHAWRGALASRRSIQLAARAEYPDLLRAFLIARRSAISPLVSRSGTALEPQQAAALPDLAR
jgi:glutathione S-transferase